MNESIPGLSIDSKGPRAAAQRILPRFEAMNTTARATFRRRALRKYISIIPRYAYTPRISRLVARRRKIPSLTRASGLYKDGMGAGGGKSESNAAQETKPELAELIQSMEGNGRPEFARLRRPAEILSRCLPRTAPRCTPWSTSGRI